MRNKILFSKIKEVKSPQYSSDGAAGIDFFHPSEFDTIIAPGDAVLIPSGIKVNLPKDYSLIAFNKSGVAVKKELAVKACVIDSDYQGEIKVHLKNESREYQTICGNEKFIQFILMYTPQAYIIEVPIDQLYDVETNRGEGGFGSTDNIYTGC